MTGRDRRHNRPEYPALGEEPFKPAECGRRLLNAGLVQCLGEAYYHENAGRIGFMSLVAVSGAPVPEGVVLTHEFHRRFLDTSGVAEAIRKTSHTRRGLRRWGQELRREHGRAKARQ